MRIVLRSFIPTKEFSKANSLFLLSKIKFIYLFILAIYILLDCATRGISRGMTSKRIHKKDVIQSEL